MLLDKEPWSKLDQVYDETYYINTDLAETSERLMKRMTTEMKLSPEEAEIRIKGNDFVNAEYIRDNVD